jgi:hypothetical protein
MIPITSGCNVLYEKWRFRRLSSRSHSEMLGVPGPSTLALNRTNWKDPKAVRCEKNEILGRIRKIGRVGRCHSARIQASMCERLTCRIDDLFGDRAGPAFIQKSLNDSPENFSALVVEKSLKIIQGHSVNRS